MPPVKVIPLSSVQPPAPEDNSLSGAIGQAIHALVQVPAGGMVKVDAEPKARRFAGFSCAMAVANLCLTSHTWEVVVRSTGSDAGVYIVAKPR